MGQGEVGMISTRITEEQKEAIRHYLVNWLDWMKQNTAHNKYNLVAEAVAEILAILQQDTAPEVEPERQGVFVYDQGINGIKFDLTGSYRLGHEKLLDTFTIEWSGPGTAIIKNTARIVLGE